jgi:hypothetical protein
MLQDSVTIPVVFQKEPCHHSCWKPKGCWPQTTEVRDWEQAAQIIARFFKSKRRIRHEIAATLLDTPVEFRDNAAR